MFNTHGKVPGSAALLRAAETGRAPVAVGRTQSRSTTPDSNHSGDTSDDQGTHDGNWLHLNQYHLLPPPEADSLKNEDLKLLRQVIEARVHS